MRTTVTLDDDVAAAVEKLRRDDALGVSEAVNRLARAGLVAPTTPRAKPFIQRTAKIGISIDVANVAEALEQLEGPEHR